MKEREREVEGIKGVLEKERVEKKDVCLDY